MQGKRKLLDKGARLNYSHTKFALGGIKAAEQALTGKPV